jgi:hypothetical protein
MCIWRSISQALVHYIRQENLTHIYTHVHTDACSLAIIRANREGLDLFGGCLNPCMENIVVHKLTLLPMNMSSNFNLPWHWWIQTRNRAQTMQIDSTYNSHNRNGDTAHSGHVLDSIYMSLPWRRCLPWRRSLPWRRCLPIYNHSERKVSMYSGICDMLSMAQIGFAKPIGSTALRRIEALVP